jgi:hypothetical protein
MEEAAARYAIRIWHRRPGAAPDDDLNNWTVWIHHRDLASWMDTCVIDEWTPEGVEPSWDA